MKALITGCAGFIGSHLAESLLQRGATVRGIDCFTDYYPRALKEANLANCRAKLDFHEANLLNADLGELLENIDVVFHLAAQAGVRSSWGEQFSIYTDNNILATQRLLEAIRSQARPPRIIYASSSSVYGDALYGKDDLLQQPLREDARCQPVSPYGVSKLAAEELCYLYYKNYAIETVALRFFTVYGPRQRPDMGFNIFMRTLAENQDIKVFGDGDQTRDFTFVADIVDGIFRAAERGQPGQVYNLGGGSRVTLNQALELIFSIAGRDQKRQTQASAKGDMRHTWADISLAQNDLGYSPATNLRTGLQAEWEWLQQSSSGGSHE